MTIIALKGFGTHPHENYEIFSYVVRGILKHKDSLGNSELIERGGVQFTSAGSGITHSVHFIHCVVNFTASEASDFDFHNRSLTDLTKKSFTFCKCG